MLCTLKTWKNAGMPRINRKLTEAEIKNAKPKAKAYKVYDEGGLYLLVRPTGTKVWQFPYRLDDKYNTFTIGQYPEIGSAEARKRRDEAKTLIREGHDPNRAKEARRRENIGIKEKTFEFLAREWFLKQTWVPKHRKNIERTFEKDVFPVIGDLQIDKITPRDIISIIEDIEARDAPDIAKRVSQHSAKIFDHAINKGLCDYNPAQGRSAIIKTKKVQHRPHLKENQLPEFLERLENYKGGKLVQLAIKLLLLTFVRPGELRHARWSEIDEANKVWRIPAARMKMRRDHIVPLSRQALEIIKQIRTISGQTDLLFPGQRRADRPISDVTLLKAFQIMGYSGENKVVPHGMRATASTILNERKFHRDAIERQLAHLEQNKIRAAYHHAEYLEERQNMMQWYADFIDKQGTKNEKEAS
jgi:integrase